MHSESNINVVFNISYKTQNLQSIGICIYFDSKENIFSMQYCGDGHWYYKHAFIDRRNIEYQYIIISEIAKIKNKKDIILKREQKKRTLKLNETETIISIYDLWFENTKLLQSPGEIFTLKNFTNHQLFKKNQEKTTKKQNKTQKNNKTDQLRVYFKVNVNFIKKSEGIYLIGSSEQLGNWDQSKAVKLSKYFDNEENIDHSLHFDNNIYSVSLDFMDKEYINPIEYKYIIKQKKSSKHDSIIWEVSENRILDLRLLINECKEVYINDGDFRVIKTIKILKIINNNFIFYVLD